MGNGQVYVLISQLTKQAKETFESQLVVLPPYEFFANWNPWTGVSPFASLTQRQDLLSYSIGHSFYPLIFYLFLLISRDEIPLDQNIETQFKTLNIDIEYL